MRKRYLEKEDLPRLVWAAIFIVATNLAAILFFVWFLQYVKWSFYAGLYFFAEIVAILHFDLTSLSYLNMRFHRRHPPLTDFNPSVDVFITSCGEDISIVERTLRAAKNIDYKNKKIYVLDDGKSARVEALVKDLGFIYLTRESREDSKGGNLNNGLRNSQGEFILVLDSDQVARPYIVKKTYRVLCT